MQFFSRELFTLSYRTQGQYFTEFVHKKSSLPHLQNIVIILLQNRLKYGMSQQL